MTSFARYFVKCAIALSLCYGIAFAQSPQSDKPKAAVYIKGNPQGREFLRTAVNTFLVKTGRYQMIAVDAIDVIAQEHSRQLGGSVSNTDIARLGLDAGAQYVCVVERSELDGTSYVTTSMVSVQTKIAELSDMKELPYGEKAINIIERQINSMLGITTGEELGGGGYGYEPVYGSAEQQQASSIASYLYVDNKVDVLVSFTRSGGSQTLTVSTDAGGYSISDLPAWCTVKESGEMFSLTCASNPTGSERREWFRVKAGGKTVVVNVYQSGSRALPASVAESRPAKPERTPWGKRKKDQSMGIGAVFASDVGGGITWNEEGREMTLSMPYYGGGFFVFWDWVYLQVFAGMHWGSWDWEYAEADPIDLPNMSRAYSNYGVLGKFPLISIGPHVTLFPLYGIDYESSRDSTSSATLKYANGGKTPDVIFDGKNSDEDPDDNRIHLSASSLSALWGKVGAGIDIGSENGGLYFFVRVEALYGIRFKANDFEKYYATGYIPPNKDSSKDGERYDAKSIPGRGLTVRVSVGLQPY